MTVSVTAPVQSSPSTKLDAVEDANPTHVLSRLLPHTLVTKDFDEHRFKAAASRQIQWPIKDRSISSDDADTRLISSPYNEGPHLLDLSSLDTQSRLLSLAFAFFKPIRDDYATAGYLESFNWAEVFDLLKAFSEAEGHSWTKQSFYVVSFRSILLPNVDQDHLYALDAYSHQEATASGGLLKYWFGAKNDKQQNLATCECISMLGHLQRLIFHRHMAKQRRCQTWGSRAVACQGSCGCSGAVSGDRLLDYAVGG